jgi:hypothetical protein
METRSARPRLNSALLLRGGRQLQAALRGSQECSVTSSLTALVRPNNVTDCFVPLQLQLLFRAAAGASVTTVLTSDVGIVTLLNGTAPVAMVATDTTGTNILLAGDFKAGYYIYDRVGVEMRYLPVVTDTSTGRPTGQAGWFAFWRVGSKVVDPNAPPEPQLLSLNTTVYGRTQGEDEDTFIVNLTEGQRFSVEVTGMQLQTQNPYDPELIVRTPDGKLLATVGSTSFGRGNPVYSINAPKTGDYVLSLRDATRSGVGDCHYVMHVGTFPRPLAAIPGGGPAGKQTAFTLIPLVPNSLLDD